MELAVALERHGLRGRAPIDPTQGVRAGRGRWGGVPRVGRKGFAPAGIEPSRRMTERTSERSSEAHEPRYGHAWVREVSRSMAHGLTTQNRGTPSLPLARKQHEAYVRALRSVGIGVTVLDPIDDLPDSHFVEDVAVLARGTAILTRPGASERRAEVDRIRPALEARLPVRELGGDARGRVDGGDVLLSGDRAWIGIGRRTNRIGAERMREHLLELDPAFVVHLVPFSGRLHLKTGLTELVPGRFIGDPGLRLERPWEGGPIEWLPEPEGHGANVLPANGAILVDASSPRATTLAEATGKLVIPRDLSEFRAMDGGLTCLSLRY